MKAEDLVEADTDFSSLIKFNGHVETVQKMLDVVKKTAYGVDFVIWGLENQAKIHYAMPLRHMVGDAFSYLKEYNEIAAKHQKAKDLKTSEEFLSKFKKTDRLHPMISLCIYYGENEWDGPTSLTEMLEIPEELKVLVPDYKMNLVQLRKSEHLHFQDPDVAVVFDVSRAIYEQNYEKINTVYKEKSIASELGMVIGAITDSQKLINQALKSEQKGGQIYMCKALEELRQEGIKEGIQRGEKRGIQTGIQAGIQTGIIANIRTCKKFQISKAATIENIMQEFSLPEEVAVKYVEKEWKA